MSPAKSGALRLLLAGWLLAIGVGTPAWAVDVPFSLEIAGRQAFAGIAKLDGKHLSGDARDGTATLHLEGDIVHGELSIQATGNLTSGSGGERNGVATGSVRPAFGKVRLSLVFSSGKGQIPNLLYLELPSQGSNTSPAPAQPAGPVLDAVGETFVTLAEVNVREKPDPLAPRVKTLAQGQKILVKSRVRGADWVLIAEDGREIGYVIAGQLARVSAAPPPAAAPATSPQPASAAVAAPAPAATGGDVPFKFVIAGKKVFEGVGKLEGRHFSADAKDGTANVHLEGDIKRGEMLIQATGNMLPGYSVERNLVASGIIRLAVGQVRLSLEFSSSHGRIANELTLNFPTSPGAPAQPAQSAAATLVDLEQIDQTYVALVEAKIRERPDATSASNRSVAAGEKITVVGRLRDESWYLVSENNKPLGYVIVDQLVPVSAYGGSASPTTGSTGPVDMANLDYGHYVALVIGNDDYKNGLPHLTTAARDAQAIGTILRDKYGFSVTLLANATREEMFTALTTLRLSLGSDDNLLIYYAGHGKYDDVGGQGYWLPVDADPQDPTNWLSNADVTTSLRAMLARHILVVADSIFAGPLVPYNYLSAKDAAYFARIVSKKSRTAFGAGTPDPASAGGAQHSAFALAFMAALQQNASIEDAQTLFGRVGKTATGNACQPLQYCSIRLAGHDGGDFVFVRKH